MKRGLLLSSRDAHMDCSRSHGQPAVSEVFAIERENLSKPERNVKGASKGTRMYAQVAICQAGHMHKHTIGRGLAFCQPLGHSSC